MNSSNTVSEMTHNLYKDPFKIKYYGSEEFFKISSPQSILLVMPLSSLNENIESLKSAYERHSIDLISN
ncbi:MAG: hypothetical protein AAFQ94_20895 [Bacteroidota bacterium]